MCGIASLVNYDGSYIDSIKRSLFHRGPDAQTHFHDKNLHLIHTRLSIQDIKNGDQPYRIGKYIIIFNGEIYNHLELRKSIKNHTFKTLSDTETLLALYIEYGNKSLEMLDGMFAFVIYNMKDNKLVFSRDRVGKKPIYFYKNDSQFFLASELNTVTRLLPNLLINEQSISSYLRVGFFHDRTTPFRGVEEVSPGFIYELDINTLEIIKTQYFNIIDQYKSPITISHQDALVQLDSILHKSVRDRLLSSDLDVGAFLSGGIDSSLIVAIASKYVENIKTFTVKFPGVYDESVIARITAKKFRTNHHELQVSMNLKDDIEKILNAYGEPFMDSSAIPSYYVSREAKKNVTVVLNGDGADEIFAGYRRYVPFANNWLKYVQYFSAISSALPKPKNKISAYNYLYRLLVMSNKSGFELFLSSTTDIYEDVYRFGSSNNNSEISKFIKKIEAENFSSLTKSLILDSCLQLPSDLLKKMDISTMSQSLEGRSPFLSKYILEWAPKLPDNEKIKGFQTKYILRELSKKYSLNYLYNQPKRGFEVPLKAWVENDLKENIYDSLKSSNSYSKHYVNQSFIKKLLDNSQSFPQEKRAKILWSLYSLECWHKNLTQSSIKSLKPNSFKNIPNRIKILYLTTGLGLGGAERVVLDICKNIDRSLYEVSVVGVSEQKNMLNTFHKNNIDAYALDYKKTIGKFVSSVFQIRNHIRNHNIQIIHAHMFHTLIIASIIKLFNKKISVVFTPHNSFYSMKIRRTILFFLKPFRDIDTVFSKNAIRFFHKNSPSIIPNGICLKDYDLDIEKPPEKQFTFIVIGRLELMKNHKFLIDEISKLSKYDFVLKIVGSGLLESSLKKQVSLLNLNHKVKFLGSRKDIPYLLSQSDCLLLPSLWEAFPIVLLEAAASNVPVITTPVGSISSLVDNESGFVVNYEDFGATMIDVMKDFTVAKNKSTKLYEKVKDHYDIASIVIDYQKVYKKLV
jgi:asparagine synthase (glutamine-hydrolysing)